jgi:TolA-binding protein
VTYWHGRVLKETGKPMEAAVEFMRVVILYPAKDKNRTAECLWQTGQALEAAKAPKAEVRKVYQEAVDRYAGTTFSDKAKADLARLGTN